LGKSVLAEAGIMNGPEARRIMGVGQGTLDQKRLTHKDPFEQNSVERLSEEPAKQPTDDDLAAIIATWMRSDD